MVTGTIAVIVDDIPADVYCNDNNDNETPKKGPAMAPKVMTVIAFLSLKAALTSSHFLR